MNPSELLSMLRGNELTEGLGEAGLVELLSSPLACEMDVFKGGIVFREGEMPKYVFILLVGRVNMQKSTFTGRRVFLTSIDEAGDVFGEVYFALQKPYDIYVEAAEKSRVLALSGELFSLGSGGRIPTLFQRNLFKIMARKAFSMNRRLQVLSSGGLRERIARLLFQEMDESGVIRLDATREALAGWLSATRPALSRELGAMRREGILRIDGRTIEVADMEKFEKYL